MHPASVDPNIAWAVWAVMIVGNFLLAVIGTWLMVRRWEE